MKKLAKIFNLKPIATVATAIVFLALILSPLSAPKPVLAWSCGDTVDFTYRGSPVTYGTVSHNGECWLARNLGASTDNPTAYNDADGYGDLFQWGRLDDNHQDRSSGTTTDLSGSDDPGHSNFIYGMGDPYDWRSPQNDDLWQGVSGTNNPCPDGWRIPTEEEWEIERTSWGSNDRNGAFASPLKLTVAGHHWYSDATLRGVSIYGYYWSSTVDGTGARLQHFFDSGAYVYSFRRADGLSVRCLKNQEAGGEAVPEFTTITLIIAAVAGFGIYMLIRRKNFGKLEQKK